MRLIRGATTVAKDEKKEIKAAVKELLDAVTAQNGISPSEILGVVFSSTSDIHSYYPARAAREAGYGSGALFSAAEPCIEGGIPLCIRVLLFADGDAPIRHVYLRGASVLRMDLTHVTIAIDGPAGSGKSTIAKCLAKNHGILYLDTGAMYRACALAVIRAGGDVNDENEATAIVSAANIDIRYADGAQQTLLDGEDVSSEIRKNAVSLAASSVSKHAGVRRRMVELQREIAAKTSCVLDGRDIGTVVLPDADFKFFLTASPDVRAKRRYAELLAKGQRVDYEALKAEITRRDEQDSTRAVSPLKQAEDAVLVDTSDLSIEEVVSRIEVIMQEHSK